ncbi:MAG: hypothetical protein APF84_14655 [Gracilibacter sp. BRH_c7a]|nr:MAG: hypothetical protein APF84_14655 [Gracilibacter sp. BRH_c7a]
MPKYKHYSYDQTILIPIDYQKQLIPGTFEHTLNYLVDNKMDLSIFEKYYNNDITGAPAWDPAIMLKIVIFGYSKGILSSRSLAEACQNHIIFKALSANSQPHFTTIASFISEMKEEILPIFRSILMVCSELDLIGGDTFAIDGCKLSSNAAKEWSGTFADLKKKKEKFERSARFLLEKHKINDQHETDYSEKEKARKQIDRILKKAEKIEKFLQESEPKDGKRGRENQSNITDNESAKMQTSKGVVQGYNGLAVSDSKHQVIVYAEAFGSGQEGQFLKSMVEQSQKLLTDMDQTPEVCMYLADTNYFSEDNLLYLANSEIDAVIPDPFFRQRDPRFADQARHKQKKHHFTQDDFLYDAQSNKYICPAGKVLASRGTRKLGDNHGRRYEAKQKDCSACELRDKCLQSPKAKCRTLFIIDYIDNRNYSEEMKQKIDTEQGRELYSKRMGIVEPVFANITYCKRMNRLSLRSKAKVNIQWLLFCLVHNIGKINSARVLPI